MTWMAQERHLHEGPLEGDVLAVGPHNRITDTDRGAIGYRYDLRAVVACCERER